MASTSDPAVTSVVTAVVTAVVNGTAVTLSHRSAAVLEALADGTVVWVRDRGSAPTAGGTVGV